MINIRPLAPLLALALLAPVAAHAACPTPSGPSVCTALGGASAGWDCDLSAIGAASETVSTRVHTDGTDICVQVNKPAGATPAHVSFETLTPGSAAPHDLIVSGGVAVDQISLYVPALGGSTTELTCPGVDLEVLVQGFANDDVLEGSSLDDACYHETLRGFGGEDTLDGRGGRDDLFGGAETDTLIAGPGAAGAAIRGEGGDDIIDCGQGDYQIEGGPGHDTITCGANHASTGVASIDGGEGNDEISFEGAHLIPVEVVGGAGNDVVQTRGSVPAVFGDVDIQAGSGDDEVNLGWTITGDAVVRLGDWNAADASALDTCVLADVDGDLELKSAGASAFDLQGDLGGNVSFTDTGLGDNALTFHGHIDGSLTASLGDGTNSLETASGTTVTGAQALTGSGDNTLALLADAVSTIDVALGSGTDDVTIGGDVRAAITVDLGDGTNFGAQTSNYVPSFASPVTWIGGSGTDTLDVSNGISPDLTLQLGDGENHTTLHATSSVTDTVHVVAGSGLDEVTFEGTAKGIDFDGSSGGANTLIVAAGGQVSTLDYRGGFSTDTLSISGLVTDVTAEMGYGGDSVTIASAHPVTGSLDIDLGYGRDGFDLSCDVVGDVFIDGGDGRDEISLDGTSIGGVSEIHGGSIGDYIHGSDSDDIIYGEHGTDEIYGGGGHDKIHGGDQDDELFGGDQGDELFGGDGDDLLCGGGDVDALFGGDDDDRLFAGNSGVAGDAELEDGEGGYNTCTSGATATAQADCDAYVPVIVASVPCSF